MIDTCTQPDAGRRWAAARGYEGRAESIEPARNPWDELSCEEANEIDASRPDDTEPTCVTLDEIEMHGRRYMHPL